MAVHKQFDIKVLCVEDEPMTLEALSQNLGRQVREVVTASNGAEGLDVFKRNKPELVITDINMPVMNGLEMARELRSLNADIPIIVTTAHSDIPYLIRAIEAGIDHYVVKPVDTGKLAAAVEKSAEIILQRRKMLEYEEERERLIAELQKALAEIKTLQGILPICSYCKKIRDDEGAWTQLETYISKHTDAVFSHGLCMDCAKKMYPDYYKENLNNTDE